MRLANTPAHGATAQTADPGLGQDGLHQPGQQNLTLTLASTLTQTLILTIIVNLKL